MKKIINWLKKLFQSLFGKKETTPTIYTVKYDPEPVSKKGDGLPGFKNNRKHTPGRHIQYAVNKDGSVKLIRHQR